MACSTFQVQSDRFLQKPEERAVATRQLEERLRAIRGVQSVNGLKSISADGSASARFGWGTEEAPRRTPANIRQSIR